MKSTFAVLAQCALISAAVIQPRQIPTTIPAPKTGDPTAPAAKSSGFGGLLQSISPLIGGIFNTPGALSGLANTFIPAAKFAGKTTLTPRYRTEAKRHVARYGPITMVGQGVSHLVFLLKN
jgi:hypothetical protein